MLVSLLPHPDSSGDAVKSIKVEIGRRGDTHPGAFWEETCFEAFLANPPGYLEFNFSPSTEWAAYRFDSHRSGMRDAAIMPPKLETLIGVDRFELRVELAMPVLGPVGLSAIIVEKDGGRSWWALAHPPGDPDFHHDACFALELPAA